MSSNTQLGHYLAAGKYAVRIKVIDKIRKLSVSPSAMFELC